MAAHQALPSLGFSRQEKWSGLPLPSPYIYASIYIYLHAFALLARISSKMLDRNHERGYTNFVPGLSGKAYSFSSLSMMLPVGFM